MGHVDAAKLYVSDTTWQVLSRMVLINFVAFIVFKILLNLVSMQNLLNGNNCWHKQNLENCPSWRHVCFQCTFRISYWCYLIFESLGCRKCFSFTWNGFSRKWGCITMRNYVERARVFVATIFLYFLPLKSSLFVVHFSNAF